MNDYTEFLSGSRAGAGALPPAAAGAAGPRPQRWCMRNTPRSISYLSRNCPNCQSSIIGNIRLISVCGFPAGGEYFRSHVAAGLGPLVVLLGQHRADEPDDGVPVREDA